jgi:hypothetical protein
MRLRWIPAALLGALAGCSAAPEARTVDAFDDELAAAVRTQAEPLVFTLAVAPPIVAGAPSGPAGTSATAVAAAAPPAQGQEKVVSPRAIDRAALSTRLLEDVRRLKLFRRVDAIPPHESSPDLAAQRRELAAAGRELRADLVLVPRVKVNEVAYVGMTGWWVPSMLCCVTLWFPTFWFPDETWAASETIEAELLSARTGKVIWGPSQFAARREADMNDFDRGWDLLGPWGIPLFSDNGALGVQESNCAAVEASLMPEVAAEAERRMLKELHGYLRRVPVKLEATEPQSFALVVGVDRYASASIPPLECAESDAHAIAKELREPAGGGLTDRTLKLLAGKDATRAAIMEFLNVDLAKMAPADRAFVYFAGYGAVLADPQIRPDDPRDPQKGYGYRKYLVAADTDPKRLEETGIALDAFADALERSPAEKVVLVFDTSWGGDIAGRTLPLARPAQGDVLDKGFLERLVARPGRFVLTAADLSGTAQEYAPERHGVFTMILEQGLREVNADKVGSRVTLGEVFDYLKERVPPSSSLVGERQDVQLFGDRATAATVILVDRTRSISTSNPQNDDRRPR